MIKPLVIIDDKKVKKTEPKKSKKMRFRVSVHNDHTAASFKEVDCKVASFILAKKFDVNGSSVWKILLWRPFKIDHSLGKYTVPGGAKKYDEDDPYVTAVRTIQECTGFVVSENSRPICAIEQFTPRRFQCINYLLEVDQANWKNDGKRANENAFSEGFLWVSFEVIKQLLEKDEFEGRIFKTIETAFKKLK
jgi:ADP-ribose pyrophosphatase YjhB (NUDIX family)